MNIKKTFFLTGLLILPLLLSACGASQESLQDENSSANSSSEQNEQQQNEEESGSQENANEAEAENQADAEEEGDTESATEELSSENWISMERLREGFRVKHPSGWYYVSNFKEAQAKGLSSLIGFGKDSGVWNQEPPYMIEIISYDKDSEIESDRYSVVLGEKGGSEFVLRSDEDLREYSDLMAESFEFID